MTGESFLGGKVHLHKGDCLDVLRTLADASMDSVVTDPPYALVSISKRFGKPGSAPPKSDGATGVYARATAGFMGKAWDTGERAFAVEFWEEVLRVLKPGGHVLAFGGTRTVHRLASAIEDAGFEIRDQIYWHYASGFPKSHDVSRGIDKARKDNADRQIVGAWLRQERERRGFKQKEVSALWPSATGGLTGCVANWELGLSCPKWDQWLALKAYIGFSDEMDAEVLRLNGRKGQPGETWKVIGEREAGCATGSVYNSFAQRVEINEPTDAARQWQGWGTALKPATEPIVVARKPLIGTVAQNILAHGTGALDIDGCRVPAGVAEPNARQGKQGDRTPGYRGGFEPAERGWDGALGRWPANVIHDGSEEVIAAFPFSAGQQGDVLGTEPSEPLGANTYGRMTGRVPAAARNDSGSAARFFACFPWENDECRSQSHVSYADRPFDLQSEPAASALTRAVEASTPGLVLKSIAFPEPSTSVTESEFASLVESVTALTQNIARRFLRGLPPENTTMTIGLVSCAGTFTLTDTTTITLGLSTCVGSAAPVTFSITLAKPEHGAQVSAHRLFYSSKADAADRIASKHPTVKPIDLMRWLVRLVTPKGGTVLDPFAGTGTTGQAAFLEGCSAILIEREAEYQADIARRMALVLAGPDEKATALAKASGKVETAGPLFTGWPGAAE